MDNDDRLPQYQFVQPGRVATVAVIAAGFFICGPLVGMFYMLFFVIFGK